MDGSGLGSAPNSFTWLLSGFSSSPMVLSIGLHTAWHVVSSRVSDQRERNRETEKERERISKTKAAMSFITCSQK